jgi:hypothetical protein
MTGMGDQTRQKGYRCAFTSTIRGTCSVITEVVVSDAGTAAAAAVCIAVLVSRTLASRLAGVNPAAAHHLLLLVIAPSLLCGSAACWSAIRSDEQSCRQGHIINNLQVCVCGNLATHKHQDIQLGETLRHFVRAMAQEERYRRPRQPSVPNPRDSSSLLSKWSFAFVGPLLDIGQKRPLQVRLACVLWCFRNIRN